MYFRSMNSYFFQIDLHARTYEVQYHGYTPVYGTLSMKIDEIVDSSRILDEIVDSSQ